MAERALTLRELNRTTLARQMLLERAAIPVPAAIARLAGMQAQLASAPFVGLWTRLQGFRREDLAGLIENRTVIKATLMRATLHLFTAEDYIRLRGAIQPALDSAQESIAKRRGGQELDLDQLLAMARDYLQEQPRTFAEISAYFSERLPAFDIGALRYSIRTRLPLVQVPVSGGWSYPGNPQFALAEDWLGQPIPMDNDFRALVMRYLAAFGPATVTDLQKWSGIGKLKAAVQALRPELVTYRDENKRELLDLPGMPLPAEDTPAPPRFLPEFDNLLLSYDKRARVVADAYRSRVYLPGLRVAATFLVDGFVRGVWKVEAKKGAASLLLEPFAALSKQETADLTAEGERLLRFVAPEASTYALKFQY